MVDGFAFRSYKDESEGTACLQVIRNDRVIFRRTNDNNGDFTLGQRAEEDSQSGITIPGIPNGTDLTGRGHPDMIVAAYSGGAHCCLSHYVFELEPVFKMLAQLDAEDSWPAYFADLDRNGKYYYLAQDWTFAYWPSSFAGSPVASIVLEFVPHGESGEYHLALNKMRTTVPPAKEWTKEIREARKTLAHDSLAMDSGATIWGPMLNLIYIGHSDLAWKFLDEAWPGDSKRKADWLSDFCSILKSSPYWADLRPSMQKEPKACADAKPNPNRN